MANRTCGFPGNAAPFCRPHRAGHGLLYLTVRNLPYKYLSKITARSYRAVIFDGNERIYRPLHVLQVWVQPLLTNASDRVPAKEKVRTRIASKLCLIRVFITTKNI
jgi:hypothetical protein